MRRPAGRADRLDQQVPVLGGGRSGEMGAGRLCLHPRRQPRRRPLARRYRHLVAARGAGSGAMRRLGRRAALVERQGRPQRHLLLCRRTSGRPPRCSPSISPRSAPGRAPPISTATWRTTAASSDRGFVQDWSKAQVYTRAERPRHARLQEPHERRLGVGPGDAVGRATRPATAATSTKTASRASSTPTSTGSRACRTGPRSRRRCSRPPTGAGRACIRAAISRASCAPLRSRNGSKCTASSTGRISTRTTASSCRRSSSATSSRARTPAGASSRRCCCRCAIPARNSSSGTRTNGRSRARNGPSSTSIRPT